MNYKILIISIFLIISNNTYSQLNKYLLAKVQAENKNYTKAFDLVEDYTEEYPEYKPAVFLKAEILLELKQYEDAISELDKLRDSYNNHILLMKARAKAGLAQNKEAIEILDKYLQSTKKSPEPIICSYPEFEQLKNENDWKNLWKKERYTKKEQLLNNILYAIKTKKYQEAHDRLNAFLDKYKTNAEAHSMKASLLFMDKKYQEALKHAEKACEKDAKNSDFKVLKANILTKINKAKKAISIYREVINKDSLYLSAYLGRAEAYFVNEEYEKADEDILKYCSYYTDDKDAQKLKADIDAANGDFLSSISSYGKLIKSSPGKVEYFVGRANAYMKTKTYKYAIRDYSMALDLNPRNIYVYKQKAKAHKMLGEMEKACYEWKHAAKLGDIESMDNLNKYCK